MTHLGSLPTVAACLAVALVSACASPAPPGDGGMRSLQSAAASQGAAAHASMLWQSPGSPVPVSPGPHAHARV